MPPIRLMANPAAKCILSSNLSIMTEMKRFFYAVIAVAATLSFAACNREVDIETPSKLGDNVLAFTIQNPVGTRAEAGVPVSQKSGSLSMGEPIDGLAYFLEESVATLDGSAFFSAPETRGTPVYTENFANMSGGKFRGLAFPAETNSWNNTNMNAGIPLVDGDFELKGDLWERSYEWDPWFEKDAVLFFGRMLEEDWTSRPQDVKGVLTNSYQFINSATGVQSMSFTYRSPDTAQEMQDIVFALRKITKQESRSAVPILFYHALTGVKFATAHLNEEDVKTYIKKVEITGIHGYGKCTITSTMENGAYEDDTADHSSKAAVEWTYQTSGEAVNSMKKMYYQEYPDTPVTYASGSGSFTSKGDYPESFSAGGRMNNLNDGDATMTFWLPAQELPLGAKVIITFEIEGLDGNRKSYQREVDLSGNDWKAGQLRTYTLKSTEVDVEIEDTVENYVKSNVVITNVGNAAAYIRAQIVGGWYGKAGSEEGVAMGFTSSSDDNFDYVQPWNDVLGDTSDGYVPYGAFVGLPGIDWIQGEDGYFYYTQVVLPGFETGSKLFTTYTLDASKIPTVYYVNSLSTRTAFTDIQLVIDIPVQGVVAPPADDSTTEVPKYKDYKAAWAAAGVTAPDAPTTVNP